MSSIERSVQEAVYTALTGDAPLMALVSGVYDGEAPQGTALPYTVIADWTEADDSAHANDGHEITVTIHDFSSYDGRRECQLIREARNAVLHLASLSVSGWSFGPVFYEFGEILLEYDTELRRNIRHQVTRYRVRALED